MTIPPPCAEDASWCGMLAWGSLAGLLEATPQISRSPSRGSYCTLSLWFKARVLSCQTPTPLSGIVHCLLFRRLSCLFSRVHSIPPKY